MKTIVSKLKFFEKTSFLRTVFFALLFIVFVAFLLQVLINSPA
jgi:hypothetical protein